MVRLITVHGTFAGDAQSTGAKWWQKGSPFLTELQSFTDDPLEIEPFHWSGANSEVARRQAGTALADRIGKCSDDPPVVLGHSHGGSVGIQALSLLFLKRGATCRDLVRGFATIGTPMLLFRQNRNPFSRFDVVGRLLLLFALGLLGMKAGELAADVYEGQKIEGLFTGILEFAGSIQFGLALAILGVLYAYTYRNGRRAKLFRQNTLFETFRERTAALNHSQDEAINGLRRARTVQPKLIRRRTVFVTIFSTLSFVLVGLFFLTQLLEASRMPVPDVLGQSYADFEEYVLDPAEDFVYARAPELSDHALFQWLLASFSVLPVAAVLALSSGIAFLTALIATPAISGFVSGRLKSQSFGDDGYGETVKAVVPGLDFEATSVGSLPEAIERQMIEASTTDAGAALQRLRELLSSGELLSTEGADLMAQAVKFEKSELLHNAYFHAPLFIRYMAVILVERFGLTPSERYRQDRSIAKFRDAMDEAAGQPAAELA